MYLHKKICTWRFWGVLQHPQAPRCLYGLANLQRAMRVSSGKGAWTWLSTLPIACRAWFCPSQRGPFVMPSASAIWMAPTLFALNLCVWQVLFSRTCPELYTWWFSINPTSSVILLLNSSLRYAIKVCYHVYSWFKLPPSQTILDQ